MAAAEVSGRETVAAALGLGPTPESPKNKVKFMCSHGGKILPRHTNGLLKYVGGETRIVSVPRDINFSGNYSSLSHHTIRKDSHFCCLFSVFKIYSKKNI